MKSSPPVSGLTASSNGKVVENIGGPPVGYEPFIGALRYVLTPRLPRWKGVKVLFVPLCKRWTATSPSASALRTGS